MEFIIIFVTAPSKREAGRIISALIKKKLCACATLLAGIDSQFIWKGRVERAKEVLILVKTRRSLFKKVMTEVKRLHSYEVPEIIAVPIVEGNREYLEWIGEVVTKK